MSFPLKPFVVLDLTDDSRTVYDLSVSTPLTSRPPTPPRLRVNVPTSPVTPVTPVTSPLTPGLYQPVSPASPYPFRAPTPAFALAEETSSPVSPPWHPYSPESPRYSPLTTTVGPSYPSDSWVNQSQLQDINPECVAKRVRKAPRMSTAPYQRVQSECNNRLRNRQSVSQLQVNSEFADRFFLLRNRLTGKFLNCTIDS